jgi:hypothetical protein
VNEGVTSRTNSGKEASRWEKQKFLICKSKKIQKEDILAVKDKYFDPKNVAIVTGATSGIGRDGMD